MKPVYGAYLDPPKCSSCPHINPNQKTIPNPQRNYIGESRVLSTAFKALSMGLTPPKVEPPSMNSTWRIS